MGFIQMIVFGGEVGMDRKKIRSGDRLIEEQIYQYWSDDVMLE